MLMPSSARPRLRCQFVESLESRTLLSEGPHVLGTSGTAPAGPGTKTLLYIIATYAEEESAPQTIDEATTSMADVNNFMSKTTFGMVGFAAEYAAVTLAKAWNQYIPAELHAEARTKAAAQGKNEANYDLVAVRFGRRNIDERSNVDYVNTAEGVVFGRYSWLGDNDWGTAAHEFGHNLQLAHARLWRPTNPETVVGPGFAAEYDYTYDNMGGGQHHGLKARWNVAARDFHGWLPASNVRTVTSADSGNFYWVHPADVADVAVPNRTYAVNRDGNVPHLLRGRTQRSRLGRCQHPKRRGDPLALGRDSRTETVLSRGHESSDPW